MKYILIFVLFSVLLFKNIHSENVKFFEIYEESVNTLATNGLNGMSLYTIERNVCAHSSDFFSLIFRYKIL